jgi:hypothetical protein
MGSNETEASSRIQAPPDDPHIQRSRYGNLNALNQPGILLRTLYPNEPALTLRIPLPARVRITVPS